MTEALQSAAERDSQTPMARKPDNTAPTITSRIPAAGATNVSVSSLVTVTFSEPLDPSTVTTATVTLRDGNNVAVPGSVTWDAPTLTATFRPSAPLAASTVYTSTVRGGGNGVSDTSGNAMVGNSSASFTTAAASPAPDTTPPTVTSRTPAPAAVGVPITSAVTATFSEALDAASVSASTVELRDGAGTLLAAAVTYDPATLTATLKPSTLLAGTTYTATLRGGTTDPRIKDRAGNALASNVTWSFTTAAANACTANAIVAENCLAGSSASEWDVVGAGDPSIQGYATQISVNQGETVVFKVKTTAASYRLDIYRLGHYAGNGARKVVSVQPSATLPQTQPDCLQDTTTGLVDCGNWSVSASWNVPATATSGVYIARLVRTDTGGASHVPFVVRNDSGRSALLFQTSDTTWQAYNSYGGNSLYVGSPAGRAYKVSYNRPFNTRGTQYQRAWLFGAEYPMIRWLEANGYDVSYSTGVDTARAGSRLLDHRVFLSVGHDEYWSGTQRANVEAARAAGVHLAFFSGNEMFWKTRWESSIDGSGTSHRTLVSYKETADNAKTDPSNEWTGTWRDPRFSPPADGGRPENAVTGTIFMVNCCQQDVITIPAALGKARFWRNTSVASLSAGQVATLPAGTLGYEWDEALENGFTPPGLVRLSSTTVSVPSKLQNYGTVYGSGTATHSLTLYRHSSGALVFGAGTIRWPWGLDVTHDADGATPNAPTAPDVRMQQATVNLLADMGVQPGSLKAGLVPASASTDGVAPVTAISSPASGASATTTSPVQVQGTASDTGGGIVTGVEVSVDGGTTWRAATGTTSWSYSFTPTTTGTLTIRARAVDDSANLESPGASVSITVAEGECPCSAFPANSVPALIGVNDGQPLQLGVKFTTTSNGYVTGLRFYKASNSTGTHTATLWTSTGQSLGSATFSNDGASGWQTITFASPIPITANTVYVASYHSPTGVYSATGNYFASAVDAGPLHLLSNAEAGGNGVYVYGSATAFPTQTWNAANYWVDVVFTQ